MYRLIILALLVSSCNECMYHSASIGTDIGIKTVHHTVVDSISSAVGLPSNFKIIASDVDNAVASVRNSERVILYNPQFIRNVYNQTNSHWSYVSVIAHEIGHHLSGHTFGGKSLRERELEADRFSGFVMRRMGATVDQATATLRIFPDGIDYPKSNERIRSVTDGWESAGDPPVQTTPRSNPYARFNKVWAEHNVRGGMVIHIDVSVYNTLKADCVVYFRERNGSPIIDRNGTYRSSDGSVSVSIAIAPTSSEERFSDLQVFIPYSELHSTGEISFHAEMFIDGTSVTKSWDNYFTFSQR